MRKLILAVALFFGLSAKAKAVEGVFIVNYSSIAISGIDVTTGTPVNILGTRPTNFKSKLGGVRVQNQDGTNGIWCSHLASVSDTTTATLGEKIAAGSDKTYQLGADPANSSQPAQLWCIAPSAVGTALVKVSIVWFGL